MITRSEIDEIVNFVKEIGHDIISNGSDFKDVEITERIYEKHKEYNNPVKSQILLACYSSFFNGAKEQSDRDIELITKKLFGGSNEN